MISFPSKLTEETLSAFNLVSKEESCILIDGEIFIIFVTWKDPEGKTPSQIPETVVIPVIVKLVPPEPIAVTLL